MSSIYAVNSQATNDQDLVSLGSLGSILEHFRPVINETAQQANDTLKKVQDTHGTDTGVLATYQKDLNDATMTQTMLSSLMKKVTDLSQSFISNTR